MKDIHQTKNMQHLKFRALGLLNLLVIFGSLRCLAIWYFPLAHITVWVIIEIFSLRYIRYLSVLEHSSKLEGLCSWSAPPFLVAKALNKNAGYIYARQTEHDVIVHLQHCLRVAA
jgi:hypothetical protein